MTLTAFHQTDVRFTKNAFCISFSDV